MVKTFYEPGTAGSDDITIGMLLDRIKDDCQKDMYWMVSQNHSWAEAHPGQRQNWAIRLDWLST